MAMLECPDCDVRLKRGLCPKCGWSPPVEEAPGMAFVPAMRACWVEGARREEDGFCSTGNGYPRGMRCPFACPLCRHPLTWDGACFACHGTTTGQRENWTFPGDCYELVKQHWVKTDSGPRPSLSVADAIQIFALMRAL